MTPPGKPTFPNKISSVSSLVYNSPQYLTQLLLKKSFTFSGTQFIGTIGVLSIFYFFLSGKFSWISLSSSVSPSIVLRNRNTLHNHHRRRISRSSPFLKPISQFQPSYSIEFCRRQRRCLNRDVCAARLSGGDEQEESIRRDEEVEKVLRMDGTIPRSSSKFLEQVSSRAYGMRRHLKQSFDTVATMRWCSAR